MSADSTAGVLAADESLRVAQGPPGALARARRHRVWRHFRRQSVGRHTGVLFAANIADRGLALLGSILIARHFSAGDVGLMAPAIVLGAIVSRVLEAGVPLVLQRETARAPDRADEMLGAGLAMRLVTAIGVLPLMFLYGWLTAGTLRGGALVALAGVTAGLTSASLMLSSVFIGALNSSYVAISQVAYRVLYVCAIAVAWMSGVSIVGLMAILTLPALVQLALNCRLRSVHAPIRMRWSIGAWRRLIAAGWALGAAGIMVMTYDRVDTLISSWYLPSAVVGNYYAAYAVFGSSLLFANAFNNVAYSMLSRRAAESIESVRRFYGRALAAIAGLGLLCALSVFLLRTWVIGLLFGPAYAQAAVYLAPLSLAIPFIFANNLGGVTLNALGRENVTLSITVVGVLTNVVLNMQFIPRYGASAAAVVTAVTEATILVANHLSVSRILRGRIRNPRQASLGT